MSLLHRIRLLALILFLVELVAYWKLTRWLSWTSELWLAGIAGLAFIGLLVVAVIAMGSSIPASMRRQVYLGGLWLLAMQGLANVLIAYQYSFAALPIEVVTRFFGVEGESARKVMALLQGATLSVVSVSFWSVLGELLRTYWEEQRQQREHLRQIEALLKETADV